MDPNTEKLYTEEEVAEMSEAERRRLLWLSRHEYEQMKAIPEGKRVEALKKLRSKEETERKKKRKAQRQARKKNR